MDREDSTTKTSLSAHVVHASEVPEYAWDGIVSWRKLICGDTGNSESLTVGIAELEVGSTTDGAVHRHQHHEVYVITSGTGLVHLDDDAHPVEAGSAVFIPGGVRHCAQNTGTETLRLVYVLAADASEDVIYDFS